MHLPLRVAASRVGMGTTPFKMLCRQAGLRRWPHRRVASVRKLLAACEALAEEPSERGWLFARWRDHLAAIPPGQMTAEAERLRLWLAKYPPTTSQRA